MPEVALSFRAICGGFVPVFIAFMFRRVLKKKAMNIRTLKLCHLRGGVVVGLLLAYLYLGVFLHRCGDVELNPGPIPGPPIPGPPTKNLRQTRMMSAGDGASAGSSSSPSSRTSGGEPTLKDVMASQKETRLASSRGPLRMDSTGRPESTSVATAAPSTDPSSDPTLKDVVTLLSNLNSKFDQMSDEFKEIKDIYANLQHDVSELKKEMSNVKSENEMLKCENDKLNVRMESLDRKVDDLEGRSKRNNIIIHGIPRPDNESWQDCEELVQDMITDKLELADNVQFDRVHRLSAKSNAPIVARCTFFKDKGKILKAKQKLRGSQIFIGEDFSVRIREIRKQLVPHMKKARSENKKVSMVYDHLLIEGTKFSLDAEDKLVQQK